MPRSSKLGRMMEQEQLDAAQAMSPSERVRLAFELGRRGIRQYMEQHGVDAETAIKALERQGAAGRQYSACMEALLK